MPLEKKGNIRYPWCLDVYLQTTKNFKDIAGRIDFGEQLATLRLIRCYLCYFVTGLVVYRRKKSEIVECLINEGLTILWLRAVFTLLICVLDVRVAFNGDIFFWDAEEWHS